MELRWVSVASTGYHALWFRAGGVCWAVYVPEQLQAGGVLTWGNPSHANFAHSGPFRASIAATKAFLFAEEILLHPFLYILV